MAKCTASWYFGKLPADKATLICTKVGKNGAFLVRESQSVQGTFTLSMFFDDEVFHHRITRPSKKSFCLEASGKTFPSLEKLVEYYSRPHDTFMYPLSFPIEPSFIEQLNKNDPKWLQGMVAVSLKSPLYDQRPFNNNSNQFAYPTPIPTPGIKPTVSSFKPTVSSFPQNVSKSKTLDSSNDDLPLPPPPIPDHSAPTEDEEESWPAPPPPLFAVEKSTPPAVMPKPKRTATRPVSCFVPAGASEQGFQRRRSLSLEEISRLGRENRRDSHGRVQRSKTLCERLPPGYSKELPKTPGKKKSPLKTLTQIFRKKKTRPSVEEVFKPHEEQEIDDGNEDASQHTPIICKTRFVTTVSHYGVENAMDFAIGTEMLLKGVRVDGWWLCYNKTTKETGWVFQDYLKPMSNEQWFEARPVETARDQRVYERIEDDSDFDDDDDDGNYCRYLIPVDGVDPNGQNTQESTSEYSIGDI